MNKYNRYIITSITKRLILFCLYVTICSCSIHSQEWHGKWIQAEGVENEHNTWQVFRKDFVLDRVPSELKARIAVDTKYWLYINDSLIVFEGGLKRGPSLESTYYDEVSLAPYLHKGKNVIAILTCYFGRNGFSYNSSGYAALLFDSYNEEIDISSDNTWKAFIHPCYSQMEIMPNNSLSESNIKYTADGFLGNWQAIEYDKKMSYAKVISESPESLMGFLVPRPIPMWRYTELKDYSSISFDAETRILTCGLPYCAHVTPYIKVDSEKGKIIDIYTDQDNFVGQQCIRGQYITCDGLQDYESLEWMVGHKIYYHIPEGVQVKAVKYRESGYDTDIVGTFSCSDDFFNELWTRSARTLYVNMRDTYMDCPDRERAQWWGDVVNEIQEVPYVMSGSAKALTNKAINELVSWQRSDNVIYSPIPSGTWFRELPVQSLMSVGYYGFYSHYLLDGDSSFVENIYNGVHRYLHDVWKLNPCGSVKEREGDWNWGDWGDNIDIELLQTCWYYLALKAELEFARLSDKSNDVSVIESLMKTIKQNFKENYWDGTAFRSKGFTGEYDDRSNALSVLCGFADENMYPIIASVLISNRFASPLMELYVFRALCKMGYVNEALDRAKDRYSLMMSNKELTTITEYFAVEGGSVNHAWGAWLPVVMAEEICGIQATSPGFKSFEIRPTLGYLEYTNFGFETPYGRIEVYISSTSIDITIPEGTTAHVVYKDVDKNVDAGSWHFDYSNINSIGETSWKRKKESDIYNLKGQKANRLDKGIKIINNQVVLSNN